MGKKRALFYVKMKKKLGKIYKVKSFLKIIKIVCLYIELRFSFVVFRFGGYHILLSLPGVMLLWQCWCLTSGRCFCEQCAASCEVSTLTGLFAWVVVLVFLSADCWFCCSVYWKICNKVIALQLYLASGLPFSMRFLYFSIIQHLKFSVHDSCISSFVL